MNKLNYITSIPIKLPFRQTFLNILLVLPCLGLLALNACSQAGANSSGDTSGRIKNMRVAIGEVKEIKLASPKDTTWQLVSSSENKEIVDVSNKQLETETPTSVQANKKRSQTFLIKGVTPGSVKVTFADKRTGEEGPGRIRKAYQVEVVTK